MKFTSFDATENDINGWLVKNPSVKITNAFANESSVFIFYDDITPPKQQVNTAPGVDWGDFTCQYGKKYKGAKLREAPIADWLNMVAYIKEKKHSWPAATGLVEAVEQYRKQVEGK